MAPTLFRISSFSLAIALAASSALGKEPNRNYGGQKMIATFPSFLVGQQLPKDVEELERRGALTQAVQRLVALADKGTTPAQSHSNASMVLWELERLRRLRREFSLAPAEFLDKLRSDVPDASLADVSRWLEQGELQAVAIDGEPRVFRREPANLFRFCEEAQKRRQMQHSSRATPASPAGDPSEKPTQYFVLNHHLRDLVKACAATYSPRIHAIRVQATHTITLKRGIVPAGKMVRCWMPFPRESHGQRNIRIVRADPVPQHIADSDAPQRTLYMERAVGDDGSTTFSVTFEYETRAHLPLLAKVRPTTQPPREDLIPYLKEEPPHIVFLPEIRDIVTSITASETEPLERARRLFDWVVTNMRYASEIEYSVMPCIVEKALATRRGDCGVQALLFITLCRAAGIPTRWVSGWVVYPSGWNMHDWAEFYVEPYGWLPADPSRGWRDDEDPRVRAFYFGNTDAYRMVANIAICSPFDPPKRHWRSDTVDNQRGELEWDGGNLYYDDWSYEVVVSTSTIGN